MSDLETQSAGAASAEGGSLLDQIMQETRIKPSDDGYETAKKGVEAFIGDLLEPSRKGEKVEQKVVDDMISEIDVRIGRQIDEVIHDKDFQHLESAWRGLQMVVDRSDFRENIKIEMLSVTKDELAEDFEDAPEIPKSGLYKHAYTAEFGQFGGQPYGVIVSNYSFNPSPQDIKLLQSVASVSAMAHAPFLAGAGPEFFGLDNFDGLPSLKDLEGIFKGRNMQNGRRSENLKMHVTLA